jgi:hypothetical protein
MIPVAFAFKGFYDIYTDDADIMLFSYIVVDWLGNVQVAYDGHSDEWYELNAANVAEMRVALKNYCRKMLEAINKSDVNILIDATKSFICVFHSLARSATVPERRS